LKEEIYDIPCNILRIFVGIYIFVHGIDMYLLKWEETN